MRSPLDVKWEVVRNHVEEDGKEKINFGNNELEKELIRLFFQLGHVEEEERDKGAIELHGFVKERCEELNERYIHYICRALYYYYWLTDLMERQKNAALQICKLVRAFDFDKGNDNKSKVFVYLDCFLKVLLRKYDTLDIHRLNKFFFLLKVLEAEFLMYLHNKKWDKSKIKAYNKVIMDNFDESSEVYYNYIYTFLDELKANDAYLEKQNKLNKYKTSKFLLLLNPFFRMICKTKEKYMLDVIYQQVFLRLTKFQLKWTLVKKKIMHYRDMCKHRTGKIFLKNICNIISPYVKDICNKNSNEKKKNNKKEKEEENQRRPQKGKASGNKEEKGELNLQFQTNRKNTYTTPATSIPIFIEEASNETCGDDDNADTSEREMKMIPLGKRSNTAVQFPKGNYDDYVRCHCKNKKVSKQTVKKKTKKNCIVVKKKNNKKENMLEKEEGEEEKVETLQGKKREKHNEINTNGSIISGFKHNDIVSKGSEPGASLLMKKRKKGGKGEEAKEKKKEKTSKKMKKKKQKKEEYENGFNGYESADAEIFKLYQILKKKKQKTYDEPCKSGKQKTCKRATLKNCENGEKREIPFHNFMKDFLKEKMKGISKKKKDTILKKTDLTKRCVNGSLSFTEEETANMEGKNKKRGGESSSKSNEKKNSKEQEEGSQMDDKKNKHLMINGNKNGHVNGKTHKLCGIKRKGKNSPEEKTLKKKIKKNNWEKDKLMSSVTLDFTEVNGNCKTGNIKRKKQVVEDVSGIKDMKNKIRKGKGKGKGKGKQNKWGEHNGDVLLCTNGKQTEGKDEFPSGKMNIEKEKSGIEKKKEIGLRLGLAKVKVEARKGKKELMNQKKSAIGNYIVKSEDYVVKKTILKKEKGKKLLSAPKKVRFDLKKNQIEYVAKDANKADKSFLYLNNLFYIY